MTKRTNDIPEAGFSTLGLDPRLLDALTTLGYEEPTQFSVPRSRP